MAKKPKRMTQREKKERKEFRDQMRAEGILPPVKKRLNRKTFAKETQEEFKRLQMDKLAHFTYVYRALKILAPSELDFAKVSPEQVGVLKVMRLANDLKKYEDDLKENGATHYKVVDLYEDVIRPVVEL